MLNGFKRVVAKNNLCEFCCSSVFSCLKGVTEGAMAASVEKHVLAAQKLLTSVKHLPSFGEARDKQLDGLRKN